MSRKYILLFLAMIMISCTLLGCENAVNKKAMKNDSATDEENIYDDVTDLQLALLNSIMFNEDLIDFEGKTIENHSELIDSKYKENILGGEKLVEQLRGYTLIDYDYGDITGFKAAAFIKGNNIVIAYCGTDHWTDYVDDIFASVFDFSAMDGQAKEFAKNNVKSYKHYNVFVTGYSMGGRLCYLGAEELYDNILAGNLKRVCTFNGLGVKEALDLTDGNLSNIHNLEFKLGDKTYDYVVEGDIVSDDEAFWSFKHNIKYLHIGTQVRVPCTNEIDAGVMKQHDLYSIIDLLVRDSQKFKEETTANESQNSFSEIIVEKEFLIGSWNTSDGVVVSFYEDGLFSTKWGVLPEEKGSWDAETITDNSLLINLEGSSIIDIMSMIYGATTSNYHFEVIKRDDDSFYLVQVYGDYTAQSSPCKLNFTRIS